VPAPPADKNATSTETDVVPITILDRENNVVRELKGPGKKGLNRIAWDLRYPLSFTPRDGDEGWFGPPVGPYVLPGEYVVKISALDKEVRGKVTVTADPRTPTNEAALRARFDESVIVNDLLRTFNEGLTALEGLEKELQRAREVVKTLKPSQSVDGDIDAYAKKLDTVKQKFGTAFGGPRFSLLDLLGQLQASTSMPTEAQRRSREQLTASLRENIGELNNVITSDWPALQKTLAAAGAASLVAKPVPLPK
jgi:hypothetical protein